MKVYKGRRGIAPLILILSARWWLVVICTHFPIYPREGTPAPEGWVGPRDVLEVLECRKIIPLAGIQTPDLPALSLFSILTRLPRLLMLYSVSDKMAGK